MSGPIGLLVIHGIGSQQSGESLAGCVRELKRAYPRARLTDRKGSEVTVELLKGLGSNEVFLGEGTWRVNLYEVHWADLLAGRAVEDSFHKFLFEETTWFPWFNWKAGLLPAEFYSGTRIRARTAQLWLSQLGAAILLEVAEFWPKSTRARVLDQILADVWNYTHSLQGVLPSGSPRAGAGQAIVDRVAGMAAQAQADGCSEIQIIAHSLGTVIAYNALTHHPPAAPGPATLPIAHLYTIGSPLEKFLLIWTRLIRPAAGISAPAIRHRNVPIAEGPSIQWFNFYSPLDLVSARLSRFPEWGDVKNIRLWGLGGLAAAHVSYYRHPAVIQHLATGLGGPSKPVSSPWRERIRWAGSSMVENVTVLLFLALGLFAGALLFIVAGALLGALSGMILYGVFGWWSAPLFARMGITLTFRGMVYGLAVADAVLILPGVVLFMTRDGFRSAARVHEKYWR